MATKLKTLGTLTLSVAGTRQRFTSTSTLAEVVYVIAGKTNNGDMYVGDVTLDSTNGYVLDANERLDIRCPNAGGGTDYLDLSELYLDGGTANDTVRVLYLQRQN